MRWTRRHMLERAKARDASCNGRFLTGVVSTGIYCLPSCPAKNPRDENVVHFATEAEARAAGLRPCRRCRPDHFYRDFDPDQAHLVALAGEVRAAPAEFANAAALAEHADVGLTKLNALFVEHVHETPASWLTGVRVEHAQRELLASDRRIVDVGLDAGFESSSSFHDNFKQRTGLAPSAYRRLRGRSEFELTLPADYHAAATLRYHGRDARSLCERRVPDGLDKAISLSGGAATLELRFAAGRASCRVRSEQPLAPGAMAGAHEAAIRMLHLGCDPRRFERRRCVAALVRGRRGLRVPLTASPFEGIAWSIIGQQVNLPFACAMRRRLVALCGTRLAPGWHAHPTPEQVAALDYDDLRPLQFSRRKAEYLIDTARLIAAGDLSLARDTATALRKRLLAVRGLGPWSADYVLMRAFGFSDCVPLGDTGLVSALGRFFALGTRPGPADTQRLMRPFSPWRSLATFHFWQLPHGDPA